MATSIESRTQGNGCEDFSLPETVITRSGARFCPYNSVWAFRDSTQSVSLNFAALQGDDNLIENAKKVFVWYAENRSASHLSNLFSRLDHFLQFLTSGNQSIKVSGIGADAILSYRSSLTTRRSWYAGALSGLLQRWHQLRIPGVTDDAYRILRTLKNKANIKGEAVATMDPVSGPFCDLDFEALRDALEQSFSNGSLTLADYVLAGLFMLLGQRPVQYAALKIIDFQLLESADESSRYLLRVPRAKTRGAKRRAEFKDRLLVPDFGRYVAEHVGVVRAYFEAKGESPDEAPMFPASASRRNEPIGFKHHRTADSLSNALTDILSKLDVRSCKTGRPLNITATRFRRTIGTRAAAEGHGEFVIAEILDHSDTQNVGVYVQAVPEVVERIDRAVAMQLAPLAQAFSGQIIRSEAEASRCGDSSSRITSPQLASETKPMGSCGHFGFCELMAPIACYTCRSFQPWLDGPHEVVLDYLIAERSRLSRQGDIRIASINDRTILAVAEVILKCAAMRKGKLGQVDG